MLRITSFNKNAITGGIDVVHSIFPFLVDPSVLEKFDLYLNNIEAILCRPKLGIDIPHVQNHGHIYFSWNNRSETLYSGPELLKLH